MDFENSKIALVGALAIQTRTAEDTLISPTDVFPESTWTYWEMNIFGSFVYYMRKFGEIMTPLGGVFLVVKIVSWLGELCFLGKVLKATQKALLWVFCQNAFLFRSYNTQQQAHINTEANLNLHLMENPV